MKQCSIDDLKPGMVLGQPIHAYYGSKRTLLLGGRAKVTAPIIEKLESIGYSFVYVDEEGTEDVIPEDVVSSETRDKALLTISRFYEGINKHVKELSQKKKSIDIMKIDTNDLKLPKPSVLRECIRDIIEDLFIVGSVRGYNTISGISRNNAILSHTLNVAVISLLIGNEYGFVDTEQMVLGMGALLHDIGKSVLSGIYEKRYWELDPSERTTMQQHPELGEKLLSTVRAISEAERQIIIQHHERQDGSGYPFGLQGDNSRPVRTHYTQPNRIFRFAEIVTIANMFDNLVSGNYYSQRLSPEEALNELYREAGTGLNSDIVRVFSSLVTLYPVGSNIKIEKHPDKDLIGDEGVVAKSDGQDSEWVEIIILYDRHGRRIPARKEAFNIYQDDTIKLTVL